MIVCANCGQENPEGFRFCGSCGAALAATPPVEAEERKLVSVLFVDLVGHTAASERADPEDVRARLRPYHQLLKREIERYGGTVEKFIGDAVMAVFGAPVAHEDDAERAVRAALRILEAVEQLGLEVREAVASGEAVVSLTARPERGEGIVAGDVVNTASRLQQAALPGGLVVGEGTYRATRDAIEYEQLEPVSLKGKSGAVPLWRVLGARGRLGVDADEAPRTPFVGREHDLAVLEDAYARAVREQAVQLLTVVGEPGVGKTRLVAEFRSWLDEQPELIRWRQGRCLPYGEGITFWALGEIMKAEAGILESDSPENAAQKLGQAVRSTVEDASEHEWVTARLAPLVGAPTRAGAVEQAEAFTAWRRFLEGLAAARPLVLLFEDLHWADPTLFVFLEELVDWTTGVPMLMLCTARPELYESNAGWGGGKRNSTTISLAPLTSDESARLVSALLSRAVLPAETQATLLERAGGNPLYAEEFVRMLRDQGVLTETGDLERDGEIALPETVHALIAARLDTLVPGRKALLHDASVVGKVFWPGAVAAIGGTARDLVREGLRELVRKELVRPARSSSVGGEDEFSFWHALVRDVAYGQIPRAARAQKHRAAAEWIEEIARERVEDHAELLADHYGRARDLAASSGDARVAEELARSEARFLMLAGDRAFHLDVAKAERYYRRALELVTAGPERAELLGKLAQAVMGTRRETDDLLDTAQEAVAAYRGLGDRAGTAAALAHLSRVYWTAGETKEAREAVEEALRLLEGSPPGPELATVCSHFAGQAVTAGRADDAVEWAEKGLAVAEELGLVPLRVRLLQFLGTARCLRGEIGGIETLRQALRLGLEAGIGSETALAYINVAGLVFEAEGPRPGLAIYDEGIEFAERRGLRGFAGWARGETVWPLFDLGEWDKIVEISWHYEGDAQINVLVETQLADVLALRGSVAEAREIMESRLPRAREIADAQILVPALLVAAEIARFEGRGAAAIEFVEELLRETKARHAFRAGVASELARICLAVDAHELLRRALEDVDDAGLIRWVLSVRSARAALAEMEGRLDEADELQREVAAEWDRLGFVYETAHARFSRGRCLIGIGRRGEAAGHLRDARKIFAKLGAAPLVAEVDGWVTQAAVG